MCGALAALVLAGGVGWVMPGAPLGRSALTPPLVQRLAPLAPAVVLADVGAVPLPEPTPVEPKDKWWSEFEAGAPPVSMGSVQPAQRVLLETTVRVPEGLTLEYASEPFDAGADGVWPEGGAGGRFTAAAGGETVSLQIDVGRVYSLRFRDEAQGLVGRSTRVSAHGEPDECQYWLCAVPRTVGHAAVQASVSLMRALEDGQRMLRCEALLPGLNPRLESACSLDERLLYLLAFELARPILGAGRSTMLLFDSAGAAASAEAAYAQLYGEPPPEGAMQFCALANKPVTRDEARGLNTMQCGPERRPAHDYCPRVSADSPCDAYVVVRPRNSRGDAVVLALMQAHAKVPDATWIIVNPELDDTQLRYTFGIKETSMHAAFLRGFQQVFLARGMYLVKRPSMSVKERGHLGMRYGEPWQALKRTADGFALLRSFDEYAADDASAEDARTKQRRQPTQAEIDAISW